MSAGKDVVVCSAVKSGIIVAVITGTGSGVVMESLFLIAKPIQAIGRDLAVVGVGCHRVT
jgi:hypothetical protein